MSRAELTDALSGRSDARWRAKQIASWVYRRAVLEFDPMHDLPASLRAELSERYAVQPLETVRHFAAKDGTEKLLVHGGDGQAFECVVFPTEERTSCCISSQLGCPMGCAFCATGKGGFDRNLSSGEIVAQYLALQRLVAARISHVVFMGMGEPLLNLPNVVKAIRLLGDEVGLSLRHITVSTVGVVPQIYKLAEEALPIHLALSLHSPFDEIRGRMMPVNRRWPVAEVIQAVRDYFKSTRRKVTIEYLMIGGVTDTPEQAAELARLVKGLQSVVNLIPFNYVETEQGFKRPTRESLRRFRAELEARGVNVTQRVERGHDIAAACGQLAGEHSGRFTRRESLSESQFLPSYPS